MLNYIMAIFLCPEKSTLRFFAIRALQFWEMALVFDYYLGNMALIFSQI